MICAIKGWQINVKKDGDIQLVLHRLLPIKPVEMTMYEWRKFADDEPTTFKIEMPKEWWEHVWPRIKSRVNIALARDMIEDVDRNVRAWIRLADDIAISFYSWDVDTHKNYRHGPFHPGCLTDHLRVPIAWWNNEIDQVTDGINKLIEHS